MSDHDAGTRPDPESGAQGEATPPGGTWQQYPPPAAYPPGAYPPPGWPQPQQPIPGQPWPAQPQQSVPGQPWPAQQPIPGQAWPTQQPQQSVPGQPWPTPQPQQPVAPPDAQQWGQSQPWGAPAQPGSAPGRDPRVPLAGHVPAAVSIDSYTTRRSRWPWLVVVAVLLIGALALYIGTRSPGPTASSASSSSPAGTASARHTTPIPTVTGNQLSVPFDNTADGAQGTWRIDKYEWDSQGVTITTTLQVSSGEQKAKFFAINNQDTSSSYDPVDSGVADNIDGRVVRAGETVTGVIRFDLPSDADTTVFLADWSGTQVTALLIPGS